MLAILSFVVCPVIPAIAALVVASTAKRNIEASGGALEGDGLVTAARVLAWIHLGLVLIGLIVALFPVAVSRGDAGLFTLAGA